MKKIIWLIVGLVIGGAGMCAYSTYVREPQRIAEAIQQTKEAIDQETLSSQTVVTGILVAIEGTTITVRVAHDIGEPSLATITTDANTAVYQMKNDEAATKEKVALSSLLLDSFVTVALDTTKVNDNSLYAKEITKI